MEASATPEYKKKNLKINAKSESNGASIERSTPMILNEICTLIAMHKITLLPAFFILFTTL